MVWRKNTMAWRKNSDASHKKLRATKFKLDAAEFKFGLTSFFGQRISEKRAATKTRPTRENSGIGRVVF